MFFFFCKSRFFQYLEQLFLQKHDLIGWILRFLGTKHNEKCFIALYRAIKETLDYAVL